MKDMFEARTQLDVAQGMDPDRVAVSKDAQSRRYVGPKYWQVIKLSLAYHPMIGQHRHHQYADNRPPLEFLSGL